MDPVIDTLIKKPVVKFAGFDWTRTDKLVPNGKASTDKLIAERPAANNE